MNEGGQSWASILSAVVFLYWGLYFAVKFFTVVKDNALVALILLGIVVGLLLRVMFRWVAVHIVMPVVPVEDERDKVVSEQPLPFFVKGQVRRRKLDITRSSNFISDSVGTKHKRQVSGMLRKKRKKGGR